MECVATHRFGRCLAWLGAAIVTLGSASKALAESASARPSPSEDLVADLSTVVGHEALPDLEVVRTQVKKNGFVVVPAFHARTSWFYMPFGHDHLPHFITTDSLYDVAHGILEDQVVTVERIFARDLVDIGRAMAKRLTPKGSPTPGHVLAWSFFLVGQALSSGEAAASDLPRPVQAELGLIAGAAGPAVSPLFGYEIDYARFRPAGPYVRDPRLERHFRAMSWYSGLSFRLESDTETDAAILIAKALRETPQAARRWTRIDRVYGKLVGRADDLTPLEYADALASAPRALDTQALRAWFRARATALRDPKTPSRRLSQSEMVDWVAHSKGMRFLGQRSLPDSQVMVALTAPQIPGRPLPTGLDVLAANGSTRALTLLTEDPDAALAGLVEARRESTKLLAQAKQEPSTHYLETLKLIESFGAASDARAPTFTRTSAWADKNLDSAAATWALARHTFQLISKLDVLAGAAATPPIIPGYVEPNPAFFAQMRRLCAVTVEALNGLAGVDLDRWRRLDRLAGRLAVMVEKELAGTPFSPEEVGLLQAWGYEQRELLDGSDDPPSLAKIVDVHAETVGAKVLQVASGKAMAIYAVVPYQGRSYLLKGGVLSYFERHSPSTQRLSDEQWEGQFEGASPPPGMPSWTSSFVANVARLGQADLEHLRSRVRSGKVVEELEYLQGEQFEALLTDLISPQHLAAHRGQYLLRTAAERLGRKVLPRLFEILESPKDDSRWEAAGALNWVVGREDLPRLRRLIASSIPAVAKASLEAVPRQLGCEDGIYGEIFLGKLGPSELRTDAIRELPYCGPGTTPLLLSAWPEFDHDLQLEALAALGEIWKARPIAPDHDDEGRDSVARTEAERANWRQAAVDHVMRLLREKRPELFWSALIAAGRMRVPEAVPLIMRNVPWDDERMAWRGADALIEIDTPEARVFLLRTLRAPKPHIRMAVAKAMIGERTTWAQSALASLLLDHGVIHYPRTSSEVRDEIADELGLAIYDAPKVDTSAPRASRDRQLAALKRYLDKHPRVLKD